MEPTYLPRAVTYVLGIDPVLGLWLVPVELSADIREYGQVNARLPGYREGDDGGMLR